MFSIAEAYFELAKQHRGLAAEAEQRDEANANRLRWFAIASTRVAGTEEAIRDLIPNCARRQIICLLSWT